MAYIKRLKNMALFKQTRDWVSVPERFFGKPFAAILAFGKKRNSEEGRGWGGGGGTWGSCWSRPQIKADVDDLPTN